MQITAIFRTIFILSFLFSLQACGILSTSKQQESSFTRQTTAIGVNGYLWQASLDTLVFMPLENLDPSSGVILSDWYSTPDNANERVKVMVRFLSSELRSDAVRVRVQRQIRQDNNWISSNVQASTALAIEEAILTQARRLRIEETTR